MAGRPKTRAKREAAERERLAREAQGLPCDDQTQAGTQTKPADATPRLPSLEFLVSDDCTISEIKLATRPLPSPDVEHLTHDDYHAMLKQLAACHKVISLLLEDTKMKVSFAENLDAIQMTVRVAEYFDSCDKSLRSYTVPGLAYAVGFINRKALITFLENNIETHQGYVLARALMRIEERRNVEILSGTGMMTGHKLDLATNFDWNDAKQRSAKEEEKPSQITQNIINYNSLPPTQMSVEEWQAKFLQQQKAKDQGVIDLPPGDQGKK